MHANDESLINWQTVMNRHHPSWSWRSADMSQTAQMVTGRCDLSWSGWSANIFTSLHNTAIKIIKVFLEQTNCQYGHHPSQVVVICPDRDNPPTISPPLQTANGQGLLPSVLNVTICRHVANWQKVMGRHDPSRIITSLVTHYESGVLDNPPSWWSTRVYLGILFGVGNIVKIFLLTTQKLLELNSLHSLKAVISGLQSAPIYRLDKTWAVSWLIITYNSMQNMCDILIFQVKYV